MECNVVDLVLQSLQVKHAARASWPAQEAHLEFTLFACTSDARALDAERVSKLWSTMAKAGDNASPMSSQPHLSRFFAFASQCVEQGGMSADAVRRLLDLCSATAHPTLCDVREFYALVETLGPCPRHCLRDSIATTSCLDQVRLLLGVPLFGSHAQQ